MEIDSPLPQGTSRETLQRATHYHVEGASPGMQALQAAIREVAQSDFSVLLLGEHGAGKKATAQHIHEISPRSDQPFRIVPCHALRCDVFGETTGLNGLGGRGTVYLDELADLDAACRICLLRFLAENDHNGRSRQAARLIFGSARNLEAEVRAGNLGEDLYYRVSSVCLHLPPLRQRREDIPRLMDHFLRKYGSDFHRPAPHLSAATYRLFEEYSWPGNLRELENTAKVLVALGDESAALACLEALRQQPDEGAGAAAISLKAVSRAASYEAEKELILKALARSRWNRRRAAEELQISYKALLYKLKRIECDEFKAS